jgi:hypothetical protein
VTAEPHWANVGTAVAGRQHRLSLVGGGPDDFKWLAERLGTGKLSSLFRRGASVIHCQRIGQHGYLPPANDDADNGPATVSVVTADTLVGWLARHYRIYAVSPKTGDETDRMFPDKVARQVLAGAAVDTSHTLNLRPIEAVSHTPVVRRDGSILDTPGYDAETRLLYLPDPDLVIPPVPERPSADEVAGARELVLRLVEGFPWVSDHDRANYLGYLLLPLLRPMYPPPYRLLILGAHQPGSGKSLLAKVLRLIHGGVLRPEMPHDDAELSKSITSILSQTTAPYVCFDNVTGTVKSSRLAALLTSAKHSDRVLCSTNETELVNDRIWMITANNAVLGGDLVRRAVWSMIDPGRPHPELRPASYFTIPALAAYVTAHRGEILAALLTLIRAWVVAGKPLAAGEEETADDFGPSNAALRGILAHAGIPGRFDHPDSRVQKFGQDDEEWSHFLESIDATMGAEWTEAGWTAKELLEKIEDTDNFEFGATHSRRQPISFDALPGELADKILKSPRSAGRVLGWWLTHRAGRWAGNLRVVDTGLTKQRAKVWKLECHSPRASRPPAAAEDDPVSCEKSPKPVLTWESAF